MERELCRKQDFLITRSNKEKQSNRKGLQTLNVGRFHGGEGSIEQYLSIENTHPHIHTNKHSDTYTQTYAHIHIHLHTHKRTHPYTHEITIKEMTKMYIRICGAMMAMQLRINGNDQKEFRL